MPFAVEGKVFEAATFFFCKAKKPTVHAVLLQRLTGFPLDARKPFRIGFLTIQFDSPSKLSSAGKQQNTCHHTDLLDQRALKKAVKMDGVDSLSAGERSVSEGGSAILEIVSGHQTAVLSLREKVTGSEPTKGQQTRGNVCVS